MPAGKSAGEPGQRKYYPYTRNLFAHILRNQLKIPGWHRKRWHFFQAPFNMIALSAGRSTTAAITCRW
jgi:hypothetical protein